MEVPLQHCQHDGCLMQTISKQSADADTTLRVDMWLSQQLSIHLCISLHLTAPCDNCLHVHGCWCCCTCQPRCDEGAEAAAAALRCCAKLFVRVHLASRFAAAFQQSRCDAAGVCFSMPSRLQLTLAESISPCECTCAVTSNSVQQVGGQLECFCVHIS